MPSDNCNNAHVTELRCVIIGNFRFSNRYQSEEYEMALFNPLVPKHRMHYQKTFIFHPGSSFGGSNRKQGLNLY